MWEHLDRGRVTAIANRRRKTIDYAISMAPIFANARKKLGRDPVLRAYADWLNERDFYTQNGAVWRAQSVSDALSVDELIKQASEAEYARTLVIEAELFRREIRLGNDRAKATERLKAAKARAEDILEQSRQEARRVRTLMRGADSRFLKPSERI